MRATPVLRTRRRVESALALLALAALADSTRAQSMDDTLPPDSLPEVVVELRSTEPRVPLSLYPPRARVTQDAPLFRCPEPPCFTELPRGEYRLFAEPTGGTVSGTADITLTRPSVVRVQTYSDLRRGLSLTAAIAGSAAAMIGMFLVLFGRCHDCRNEEEEAASERNGLIGLPLFAAGAAFAVTGWIDFGTTRNPRVEVVERR